MISLPNLLSLGRLLSVPLLVWLMLDGRFEAAFLLFFISGLTDAADGLIARHFNSRTALGSYLDPLADKTLLVSVYVTLGHLGHLPVWLVILVVFRDVTIIGGVLLLQILLGAGPIRPSWISKLNTAAQIALAAVALANLGFAIGWSGLSQALIYLVGGTTALSGLGYLVHWTRQLSGLEPG